MKATYKVMRNEDNKVISRIFVIEDNDREALLFIAERLNLFNTDLVANDTLYAYVFDSYTGTVAAMKELFRKEYNAAKEALKANKEQAPAPAMVDTEKTEAPAPAKVKKVRRRNRQMVKAVKIAKNNASSIYNDSMMAAIKRGTAGPRFYSFARLRKMINKYPSVMKKYTTPFYNVA